MLERILLSRFSGAEELLLALLLSLILGALSGWNWARTIQSGLSRMASAIWRRLQKSGPFGDSRWGPILFSFLYALLLGLLVAFLPIWIGLGVGAFGASISRILLLTLALPFGWWLRAGLAIRAKLRKEELDSAREQLHKLTGQDAEKMTLRGISRSACEGLAKELLYGVLTPLFCWAFGHGFRISLMPLLICWAYMLFRSLAKGEYEGDGLAYVSFAEKGVRMFCYLPANLGAILLLLAAFIMGKNGKSAWLTALQQGNRATDRNAGMALSVLAGALGIRLGGGAYYNGSWLADGEIGFDVNTPDSKSLGSAMLLLSISLLPYAALAAFFPRWMGFAAVLASLAFWVGRFRLLRGKP